MSKMFSTYESSESHHEEALDTPKWRAVSQDNSGVISQSIKGMKVKERLGSCPRVKGTERDRTTECNLWPELTKFALTKDIIGMTGNS